METMVKNSTDKNKEKETVTNLKKRRNYKKELELVRDELANVKDQLLRKAAEFDNYRRRTEQEFSSLINNANSDLITDLLPVLDDLERSLGSKDKVTDVESFAQGVELIYQKFLKILESRGLKPIEAVGKEFDTEEHEALMAVENDGHKSNHVVQEHLKGYKLNDKVLRHSQVVVSK